MNTLEKEFVPYEEALELKELGFDEPCFGYLKPNVLTYEITIGEFNEFEHHSAPTFSQAFRWFDENTELMGFVVPSIKDGHFDWLIRIDWEEEIECEEAYPSRQEAELACLTKLIEIVEQQNQK